MKFIRHAAAIMAIIGFLLVLSVMKDAIQTNGITTPVSIAPSSSIPPTPPSPSVQPKKNLNSYNALIEKGMDANALVSLSKQGGIIRQLYPEWYSVDGQGQIKKNVSSGSAEIEQMAHEKNILLSPIISFSLPSGVDALLTSDTKQQLQLKTINTLAKNGNYAGIVLAWDSPIASTSAQFLVFAKELGKILHEDERISALRIIQSNGQFTPCTPSVCKKYVDDVLVSLSHDTPLPKDTIPMISVRDWEEAMTLVGKDLPSATVLVPVNTALAKILRANAHNISSFILYPLGKEEETLWTTLP